VIGPEHRVQRFILQENIKLLRTRLSAAAGEDDRRRVRDILAAVERELATLDSMKAGVLAPGARIGAEPDPAAREALIAAFLTEYGQSPEPATLIDPAPGLIYVETNASYLAVTDLTRDEIVGRSLFERFPDNPEDPSADGIHSLYTLLRQVAETRQTGALELMRYDLQGPDGAFHERYWQPVASALMDSAGNLVLLRVVVCEVTQEVQAARRSA
jgi:PAS domain-containing protein